MSNGKMIYLAIHLSFAIEVSILQDSFCHMSSLLIFGEFAYVSVAKYHKILHIHSVIHPMSDQIKVQQY